jgi:Trk K+ transport system NAD-binding subunit
MRGVLAAYEQWRQSEVHATGRIAETEVILKVGIRALSPVAGQAVRTLNLPQGALLVAIERPDGAIVPHGDTVLEPGDIVHAVAAFGSEEALLASLTGGVREAPVGEG